MKGNSRFANRHLSPADRTPRAERFPCSPDATIIIVHFWTKTLHFLLEYFMACRFIQNKILVKHDHKWFKMAPCEIMNANTYASNACIHVVHILVSIFMFLMFYEQLGNVW